MSPVRFASTRLQLSLVLQGVYVAVGGVMMDWVYWTRSGLGRALDSLVLPCPCFGGPLSESGFSHCIVLKTWASN